MSLSICLFYPLFSYSSQLGAFFNAVAEEIGREQAQASLSKSAENLGTMSGKMTKEQMGIEKLDVSTVGSIMKGMVETYGLTSEVEEGPNTVLVKNYKCPFYDGLQAGFACAQALITVLAF